MLILFLFTSVSQAKDFGIQGQVKDIKEDNFLNVIEQRLQEYLKIHSLEELQQEVISKFKQNFDLKDVKLAKAEADKVWYFDPSVNSEELHDEHGNLIEGSGKPINPLNFINLSKMLIFIDSTDPEQISYLKKKISKPGNYKIILVNGNPIDLSEELEEQVYYDYNQQFVKRFGLKAVPSLVEQEEQKLRITEVLLKEKSNENN